MSSYYSSIGLQLSNQSQLYNVLNDWKQPKIKKWLIILNKQQSQNYFEYRYLKTHQNATIFTCNLESNVTSAQNIA